MKKIVPAAIAAVVLAGAGWWYLSQSSGPQVTQISAGGEVSDEAAAVDTSGITEMVIGSADAPVEIIEYASYTCPHCATFHTNVFDRLKEDYIDTGKVKFVYREVYFDKYGMWASLIARCGGEEKFFGITDLIYKGQSSWARAGGDAAIADELRKIGRLAGMDSAQLDACLEDGDKLQTLIAWYQQNAAEHGITSTPSFVVNGETFSNMSYGDFAALIDERL